MKRLLIIEELASYGYLGILLLILAINLLPFASPSNLVLAGAVVYFTSMNPVAIAFIVAVGATLGKLVHFYIAAALGKRVNHSDGKLSNYSRILGEWGALGAFIAAVTPIPDDPVVIPLGLMRYNSLRFTACYFLGKLTITLLGAYGAKVAAVRLDTLFGTSNSIVASLILSVLAITVLLKTDPSKVREYMSRLRCGMGKKRGNVPVRESN
jgi:membrane protein DedA with SNARE-associated domain